MNYFQLFGLEVKFTLDLNALSETYQSLQKSVHPDRFAHASSQEQLQAVQKSSQVNDGYQTLRKPLSRAEHLLELRGCELPDEQSTFKDGKFLMEQMELREMLEDVKHSSDIDEAIFEAQQAVDQGYQLYFGQMVKQLNEDSIEANQLASENLRKLKFFEKLNIEIERLEDKLLDD